MKVKVLNEAGYEEAAFGFSLSYNSTSERAKELFPAFSGKDGGENKFLESMMVWLDVDAPRFLWSQMDTYRISTKQSESTMHTLTKRLLTQEDFEDPIPECFLEELNKLISEKNLERAKALLPESFLQRRIWCMSYKTLRNVIHQRKNHKLKQWQYFISEVLTQVKYPEFLK